MSAGETLIDVVRRLDDDRPKFVAIDGHSAAGKSTLAAEVARPLEAAVIDGDEFYAGGTEELWDAMSPAEKAAHCVDWRKQRRVLEALARAEDAQWHSYDWDAGDGRLLDRVTVCPPAPVVILEGVYSARPELADLFQLRVLYDAAPELRHLRWVNREGEGYYDDWARRWSEAEDWYFSQVMTPDRFDLVLPAE
jgi:uridine kinase